MALYYIPTDLITLPSALGGELITFDATGSSVIVAAGSDGDILSVVAGVPAFISSLPATQVSYDPATSGLVATDVQAAIDEIEARLDAAELAITNLQNDLANLTFLDLTDTPANYVGQAYRGVRVNSTADGLEYSSTEALFVDSGSTAQRPSSPSNGMIRYNTDNNEFEGYIAGSWQPIGSGGGGGGIAIASQTYYLTTDYDGATTDTLTLPATQTDEAYVFVFADGVWEHRENEAPTLPNWSVINAGADIQFDAPIPAFVDKIEIKVFETAVPVSFPVTSVFGRGDDVIALAGDYSADLITYNNATSGLTATDVQAAIDEIDSTVDGISAQNLFERIAVSGQSDIVADSPTDILTIVAGTNITLTTDAGTDTLTINAAGGGGGLDIDTLPVAGALNNADLAVVSQGGTESQVTLGLLGAFFGAPGGATILNTDLFLVNGSFTPNLSASSGIIIAVGGGGGGSDGTIPGSSGGLSNLGGQVAGAGGTGSGGNDGGAGGGTNGGLSGPGNTYQTINIEGGSGTKGSAGFNPGTGDATFIGDAGIGGSSFFGGVGAFGAGGNGVEAAANDPAGGGGGAGGTSIGIYNGSWQTYFAPGGAPYTVTVGAGGAGGGLAQAGTQGAVLIIEFA